MSKIRVVLTGEEVHLNRGCVYGAKQARLYATADAQRMRMNTIPQMNIFPTALVYIVIHNAKVIKQLRNC